jgi:hypothetical protein
MSGSTHIIQQKGKMTTVVYYCDLPSLLSLYHTHSSFYHHLNDKDTLLLLFPLVFQGVHTDTPEYTKILTLQEGISKGEVKFPQLLRGVSEYYLSLFSPRILPDDTLIPRLAEYGRLEQLKAMNGTRNNAHTSECFIRAAKYGQVDVIKYYRSKSRYMLLFNTSNIIHKAILAACEYNQLQAFKTILESGGFGLINEEEVCHAMMKSGNKELIKHVSRVFGIDAFTLIEIAAEYGMVEVVDEECRNGNEEDRVLAFKGAAMGNQLLLMEKYKPGNSKDMDEVVDHCIYHKAEKSIRWMRDNGATNYKEYLTTAVHVSVGMVKLIQELYPMAVLDKDEALRCCLCESSDWDAGESDRVDTTDVEELVEYLVSLGAQMPSLEAFQEGIPRSQLLILSRMGCVFRIEK